MKSWNEQEADARWNVRFAIGLIVAFALTMVIGATIRSVRDWRGAKAAGARAYQNGLLAEVNPFTGTSSYQAEAWQEGWLDAKDARASGKD